MPKMIEKVVCLSTSMFGDMLSKSEKLSAESGRPLFVLFTGEKSKSTGRSWCGDCTNAEPVIDKALNAIPGGCILLECPVALSEYRSSSYAYRTLPSIKLACVPTLMKWGKGKYIAKLNDYQSQDINLVEELVNA